MAVVLDPSLCPSCFSPRYTRGTCDYCGYNRATAIAADVLTPGTELAGRYVVGGVLGQGGFGVTYRGYDGRLTSPVAIKEFFPLGGATRTAQGMVTAGRGPAQEIYEYGRGKFLEEARTLAKLRHIQKVVSVFDFFEENNTAYIIMEFLSGVTLKQFQGKHKDDRVPLHVALPVFVEILSALLEIHKHSILHRDISPDNIFIGGDGSIKLLDFGAARQALSCKDQRMTVILKAGYAPLEQYSNVSNHGPWSDIYAAGATFYKCLSGTKPVDSLSRVIADTLPPLSALGITIAPRVEQAIMRALAVQPKDRWQTAGEFAEELRQGMDGGGPSARVKNGDREKETTRTGMSAPVATAVPVLAAGYAPKEPPELTGTDFSGEHTHTAVKGGKPGPDEVAQERKKVAHGTNGADADPDVGRPISAVELRKVLQEHARFLSGKINGRRLNLSMSSVSGIKMPGVNLSHAELSAVNFARCDLSYANLSTSTLFCANFTGANLSNAKFNRCDLRGAQFDGAELTGASFVDADCREGVMMLHRKGGQLEDIKDVISRRVASFANAKMTGAVFCNANLGSAIFENASLEEANFAGADLRDANMAGAMLKNAKFERANLVKCDFDAACLDGVDTSAIEFRGAKIVRDLAQIDENLQQKIVEHRRWVESLSHHGKRLVLNSGDLSGLQMVNVDWSAAEFISVNMTDINLTNAKISMTDFSGSLLNGACLVAVDARGAKFSACEMRNADFTRATLSHITMGSKKKVCSTFKKSDLRGSKFDAADCQGADFGDADLTKANFQNALLRNANFTGAIVGGVNFTGANLDGAIGLAREA